MATKDWTKIMKYWITRSLRIGAFALATGIAFMGAGNVFGISAIQSAAFGAVGAVLGLLATLLFTYAGKASVPDEDFNQAINKAIESVSSETKKKKSD
jgi:hypothetical protein